MKFYRTADLEFGAQGMFDSAFWAAESPNIKLVEQCSLVRLWSPFPNGTSLHCALQTIMTGETQLHGIEPETMHR